MDSLSRNCPVPFETELKHIKAYLSLEKMRFNNKLEIVWDIKASGFMLPTLSCFEKRRWKAVHPMLRELWRFFGG